MPKVTHGDITLYYEIVGTGKPLVLIAGVGSDHMSWLGVAQALSKRFQIILFDNRGCGQSSSPDQSYTIRQMADDTARLLDHLKIERCHVVGHSMGGYIAQDLAIRCPGRVDKLVLEGTAPVSSARNNILLHDLLARLERTGDFEAWIRQWTFWLFSPETFKRRKTFIKTFIKNAVAHPHPQSITGFHRQIGAVSLFDARACVKKIRAKTLVLIGEDDILITPDESRALLREIRHSRLAALPNTGHCMHLENPSGFAGEVERFLR